MADPLPPRGDMPPEEFRAHAERALDWAAAFLADPGRLPVTPATSPGDVMRRLESAAPAEGRPFAELLDEFEQLLVPASMQWNHPGFLGYFAITGSGPGIIAELLAATLNLNAMLWSTGPAATELELRATDWVREMVGLPAGWLGTIQDTASTSTLTALAGARQRALPGVAGEGLVQSGAPRLRVYASAEAHNVVEKACATLGIGVAGVRRVPMATGGGMDAGLLRAALAEDRAGGWTPMAVVATAGTTSTAAFDPLEEIAEACREEALWLHVDAAYGGAAAAVPELRAPFAGWERADSIVINPHKWLFVPVDCSVLLLRDPQPVRHAFSAIPLDILESGRPGGVGEPAESGWPGGVVDLMEYGPALGRRFRALKLWMVLAYFGKEGIAARLRHHCALAAKLAEWVEAERGWHLLAPCSLSVAVFRHAPQGLDEADLDAHNQAILDRVNATREVFLSRTRVDGRLALRIAVGNLHTEEPHLARAWELLRDSAASPGRAHGRSDPGRGR